jgi:hypothetical protein
MSLNGYTVLVVDDERDTLSLLLDVRSKISIKHKIWYPHQHDDKKRNR